MQPVFSPQKVSRNFPDRSLYMEHVCECIMEESEFQWKKIFFAKKYLLRSYFVLNSKQIFSNRNAGFFMDFRLTALLT